MLCVPLREPFQGYFYLHFNLIFTVQLYLIAHRKDVKVDNSYFFFVDIAQKHYSVIYKILLAFALHLVR